LEDEEPLETEEGGYKEPLETEPTEEGIFLAWGFWSPS
jgi:hypothetical protein